jgi:murein DD-endopeptidase MepM/ murein hydrolase activator NlpD
MILVSTAWQKPDAEDTRRMNIIIVAKPGARPISFNLAGWRARAQVAVGVSAYALGCAAIGFAAALIFANPRDTMLQKMETLRGSIATQRTSIVQLETASRRDLDAFALQLGNLQAQATRLNALGQRLTEIGKLDDGEFDFTQAPALGGPEDPASVSHNLNFDLAGNIANLRTQFTDEETQLNVLERLLLDRKLDNSLLPSGYPVAAGYIGSGFGERTDPINGFGEFHTGIDFDAPAGTAITAVADGVVSFNGERPGYGNVVEIDHGNGYMTRYAHNSRNVARVGQRVRAGDVIARVGATGRATGPHCHFEVWLNGHAVNPLTYVKRTPKRA